MKNWWTEHFGELITITVIVVGNLWGYARLTFQVLAQGKRLDKVEDDFSRHSDSSGLHRNADFEKRLERMEQSLESINNKLDKVIGR